jgi:hypothetical protein
MVDVSTRVAGLYSPTVQEEEMQPLAAYRAAALVAVLCASALALSACGGSDHGQAPKPSGLSLVSPSGIDRLRPGSAEQAFIEYWASLQFDAWPQAAAFYAPAVRNRVGQARLVQAFDEHSEYFRAAEPRIVGSVATRGLRRIRYVVKDPKGRRVPRSVTFRKAGSRWEIVYDSFLHVGSPRAQAGDGEKKG